MRKLLLTCSLVALLAAPFAFAQPGGGFRLGGDQLLLQKSVQEELKLTDSQKEKLAEVQKAVAKAGFKDKEGREEAMKGVTKVKDDLKDEQKKRLKQIELQVSVQFGGVGALAKEEVAKSLKLTDKQKEEIKELGDEFRKDAGEIFKDAKGDKEKFQEAQKKIAKLRQDSVDKVTKTFTDEQKSAYKELTGAPFEGRIEFGGGFKNKDKKGKDKDKNP